MGKTSKKEFHKKTDKFKSNRYSGWDHFKIIPFGLKGWDWFYQRQRDKFGNISEHEREDVLSTINKSSKRMKDKLELKKEIDEIENDNQLLFFSLDKKYYFCIVNLK